MKLSKEYPLLYGRYKSMINRCYSTETSGYSLYGKTGVTVCEEWLNKETGSENYIKWCLSQMDYSKMKNLQIDKDIGSARLKIYPPIYSPSTCTFLTRSENMSFTKKCNKNNTSGYRGVHKTGSNKWVSEIRIHGKLIQLGVYDSKLDAAKAYDYYILISNKKSRTNNVLSKNETVENITVSGYENPIRNTSIHKGIHFERKRNKWKAMHKDINNNHIFIGRFKTEAEALSALNIYKNSIRSTTIESTS